MRQNLFLKVSDLVLIETSKTTGGTPPRDVRRAPTRRRNQRLLQHVRHMCAAVAAHTVPVRADSTTAGARKPEIDRAVDE